MVAISANSNANVTNECKKAIEMSFLMVYSVQVLAIFVGNLLTCVVFLSKRQLRRTNMNIFLINLAVSDFLVSILLFPGYTIFCASCLTSQFSKHDRICIILDGIKDYVLLATIFNILAITFDRYVAVLQPFRYPMKITKKTITIMLVLTWLVPWPLAYMKLILVAISPTIFHDELHRSVYDNVIVFVCVILPMFIIAVVNGMITKVIRKQMARINYHGNVYVSESLQHGSRDKVNEIIKTNKGETKDNNEEEPQTPKFEHQKNRTNLNHVTNKSRDSHVTEDHTRDFSPIPKEGQSFEQAHNVGHVTNTSRDSHVTDAPTRDSSSISPKEGQSWEQGSNLGHVTHTSRDSHVTEASLEEQTSLGNVFIAEDARNKNTELSLEKLEKSENTKKNIFELTRPKRPRVSGCSSWSVGVSNNGYKINEGGSTERKRDERLDDSAATTAAKKLQHKNNNKNSSKSSSKSISKRLRQISRDLRERNGTRSCLVVAMIFVVCWIPRCLLNMFQLFGPRGFIDEYLLEKISFLFLFFQSLTNPLVYSFYRNDFRHAARDLINKKKSK